MEETEQSFPILCYLRWPLENIGFSYEGCEDGTGGASPQWLEEHVACVGTCPSSNSKHVLPCPYLTLLLDHV